MKTAERHLPRFSLFRRGKILPIFLLLGASLLSVLLFSCGSQQEETFEGGSFVLTPEDMQGFTVVRSDSASDFVVKESLRICQTISDATGEKVDLVTDWQRKSALSGEKNESGGSDIGGEGNLELLVGLTSREESEALLPELADGDHFLLRTIGRKILIASTSESLLTDAVDKFLADFVSVREGEVRIARKIDYQSENYGYFCLAKGGESQCGFVLPDNASTALTKAVNDTVKQMEKDFGCPFQVYREGSLPSLSGMIVVGKFDSPLCNTVLSLAGDAEQGIVKYAGDRYFIAGKNDESTVAALSEFYALLRAEPDTDFTGYPYVRLRKDVSLSCGWDHPGVPYLLGAHKQEEVSIATTELQVVFTGVTYDLLELYADTLKKEGFTIFWRSVGESKSFLAENALLRLQVNHTSSTGVTSVYIFRKDK